MEKLIIALIFLSSILLPNFAISQNSFKEIGGLLIISLLIVSWVWKFNKWLSALVLWFVVRMMLPPFQPYGMVVITNVFMGLTVYLFIKNVKFDWVRIYQAIAITCLIQIATVFLQWSNLFFCWNAMNDGGRVWGLFGNSNWSGCYIAMTMPVCLILSKRSKWYLLSLLGLSALLIMDANFATLAGFTSVGLFFYLTYRDKLLQLKADKIILTSLLLLTAFVIIKPVYMWDGGRYEIWNRAYKFCKFNLPNNGEAGRNGQDPSMQSHFVQGRGLGECRRLLPMIQPKEYTDSNQTWTHTHNEYLNLLFDAGLIGLIIFIGLIVTSFRRAKNIAFACGLVAILVNSIGFFPFHTSPIGYLALIYLGGLDAVLPEC